MRRDISSDLQQRTTQWCMIGRLSSTNPVQLTKVKALSFAPVLEEALDVAYSPDYSLYDELTELENQNSLSSIDKSEQISGSYEPHSIAGVLRKFDWEGIFEEYISNLKEYAPYMQRGILKFLHFKMLTNQKINSIRSSLEIKEKENRLSTAKIHVENAEDLGLPKNHWIGNAFCHYWDGSCYDLMRSPVVSLMGIDVDISNSIKSISDALQKADGRYITSTRSMVVDLLVRTKLFDRFGLEALESFEAKDESHNWIDIVDKRLVAEGVKYSDRYLLCDSLFWMLHSGCMRRAIPNENASDAVLTIYKSWQPFGVKTLLDYPE